MRENKYQSELIKRIEERFPDSIVMKNDSSYIQGIPDLTVLNGDKWAFLEVKKSEKDYKKDFTPNQHYYVDKANDMKGFGSFIFPEIEQEVLDAMEQSFARHSRRKSRISGGK